jgi:osmotically-inducible protein OsmY
MKNRLALSVLAVALSQVAGCAAVVVGGAATGAAVSVDRRTAGVVVSDQEIELRAFNRLRENFPANGFSVSATSYNRQVLLTGQVPDETTRTKAEEVVRAIPDVRKVFNETAISGVTSLTSDSNDTALTAKIKTGMLRDDRVPGTKVKIVTEAGVVYLMGLLSHAEADAAAEVASNTSGVTKVVKLFEYIN